MGKLMIIFSHDGTMNRYIYLVRFLEEELKMLNGISTTKRGNP
jgi:hypothetical protein